MNERVIEQIVSQVLRQLRKRILVLITPALDYEQVVYQRLKQLSMVSFSVYMTEEQVKQGHLVDWKQLGEVLTVDTLLCSTLREYDSLFVPFIDAQLVNEIANGSPVSEAGQIILSDLAQNIPVMALKYHCCPESELNQILGFNKNKQYNHLIKENIRKTISLGIQFDVLNEIENKILLTEFNNIKPKENDNNLIRYITLHEVMNDPRAFSLNTHKLTDSAIDYLKTLNK